MDFELKKNPSRKLTQTQVDEIRHWLSQGATHGSLARHYRVSAGQIGRIARGESWAPTAGLPQELSPANQDAALQRMKAAAALRNESPELLTMAKDFQAFLAEPAPTQREFVYPPRLGIDPVAELGAAPSIEIPLSPLDGGDIPDAVEGAVDVLQDKARAQGVDIDKLLK